MKEIVFVVLEIASGVCGIAAVCGFVMRRWKAGGILFVSSILSGITATCIEMNISGVTTEKVLLIVYSLTLLVIFGIFAYAAKHHESN